MVLLAASQPVINIDDNFLVHNGWTEPELFNNPTESGPRLLEPRPIVMRWNRREYIVNPGETKQVPFDALRVAFGDPRAIIGNEQRFPGEDGRNGIIPKREAEVIRLSIHWGLYQQGAHLLPEYPPVKHVKITTVELDPSHPAIPVFTPATDPSGAKAIYGHPEVEINRADFLQIVEENERKTAMLERRLNEAMEILAWKGITAEVPGDEEPETVEKDLPHFP